MSSTPRGNRRSTVVDMIFYRYPDCGHFPTARRYTCWEGHRICQACVDVERMSIHFADECHYCCQQERGYATPVIRDRTAEELDAILRASYEEKDLQAALICPVCVTVPAGRKVHLCPNSHRLCGSCMARLGKDECPTCKAAYSTLMSRDMTAEKVMVALELGLPCPNGGCGQRVATEEEHLAVKIQVK